MSNDPPATDLPSTDPPSNDPWRLDGRVALVTGASRGIGAAVAAELLDRGAAVLLVARDPAVLGGEVDAHRAAGRPATGVVADVATPEGRGTVLRAIATAGRLDVLVNNVGTNIRRASLEATAEDWERIVRTNVTSAWELTRGCHAWLARSNAASVVNMSSVAAFRTIRTSTAIYTMTKGAIEGMTRFFAVEWGPARIRVNCVAPWYVRTPLTAAVLDAPATAAAILDRTPLGRLGTPEDVARAIAFLAMPASSWITGVCLPVDGGALALGF
jgi:Tropinone reductase 1